MTNNKQQTAVEWFISQLQKTRDWQRVINEANQSTTSVRNVLQQAKAMHKKEIEDACKSSITSCGMGHIFIELPEQYYNETYGGGEQ